MAGEPYPRVFTDGQLLYNARGMQSHVVGPEQPLIDKTIPDVFDITAEKFLDREALVSRHQGIRHSYRRLRQEVARTAAGLWGLGLRPRDRVGVWASNCAEWIYLQVAVARIGAVLVNVNPAYRSHDLAYIIERSGIKALFFHEQDARVNYVDILAEARQGSDSALAHAVVLARGADALAPSGEGLTSWAEMISGGEEPPPYHDDPNEVVNIQYTSGTTGKPKGVLLSHKNLVNNAFLVGAGLRWSEQDRLCLGVPLYHCFGCVMGSLQSIVYGAALVLPSAQFDPGAVLRAIEQERCTTIYGVPTMFVAELAHPEFSDRDMTSLRTGIMAGAPCPIELMKRVVEEMHCSEMTIAYGQTESSPVITQSSTDDSLEVRVATVGRAMPNTQVKIVDDDTGETLPVGHQGELCTRGYLVMKGYDNDPDATAAAIDFEGWLHTGDLATMREDGNFRITGRAKEMIIRGGENIYPREIEEFLHTHPKINDVYVVGLPDERLGERVLAWIQLKTGEQVVEKEIRDYCQGKVAHFKIPDYMRFVDEFPMTVTGKVQKFLIREQEIKLRGLEKAAGVETA